MPKNVSRIVKIVHSASNYLLHFYPIFLTTCALLELLIQRTMSIDTILLVELSVLYPWLRYHWPSLVFPNDWISSNASSVNVQFFHQNFLCECNISTGKWKTKNRYIIAAYIQNLRFNQNAVHITDTENLQLHFEVFQSFQRLDFS